MSRNPISGENAVYGEYLPNAVGSDVLTGKRQAHSLNSLPPSVQESLKSVCKGLENHYKDMQEIEFAMESGRLSVLRCRIGKRTPKAR